MDFKELNKQAQQVLATMQRELADLEIEAAVGGGMVSVTMNGGKQLLKVSIDPEVLDPKDPALVEDLVLAAVNEAVRKVDQELQSRLGGLATGIPGFPSLR